MFVRKPTLQEKKLDELCDYITNMINPSMWLMVWQWCHSLIAYNTREVQPWIKHAKLH